VTRMSEVLAQNSSLQARLGHVHGKIWMRDVTHFRVLHLAFLKARAPLLIVTVTGLCRDVLSSRRPHVYRL
jgi:hypothetical protein